MHRIALCVATIVTLAACSTRPQLAGHGNFAGAPPAVSKAMAADVINKLVVLFPPAKTRMQLQHAATDPFGSALASGMRAKGFALQEFNVKVPGSGEAAAVNKLAGLQLAYVLDQPTGEQLYRVTVSINQSRLSRAYLLKNGTAEPAGYWMKEE